MDNELLCALKSALRVWDHKTVSVIALIQERFQTHQDYLAALIELMGARETERGATWLFKKHCETRDTKLSEPLSDRYHACIPNLHHWEAKLHALQCMEFIPPNSAHRNALEAFLRHCTASDKKLIRAWGYNGLARLALVCPDLAEDVKALLSNALSAGQGGAVAVRVKKARSLL